MKLVLWCWGVRIAWRSRGFASRAARSWCGCRRPTRRRCGAGRARARSEGRGEVRWRDAPGPGGGGCEVRWRKRIWWCPRVGCEVRAWTGECELAGPRRVLIRRAAQWAVGRLAAVEGTVASAARRLGVAAATVWSWVGGAARQVADDPERVGAVVRLGLDDRDGLRWAAAPPPLCVRRCRCRDRAGARRVRRPQRR